MSPSSVVVSRPRWLAAGHTLLMPVDERFSRQLERWLADGQSRTLGSLIELSAEKSFAVTVFLLMFVPALPLPTGGITHVFEVIAVVVAVQMVLGRHTVWLPERWKRRELGAVMTDRALPLMMRWVRRLERLSRPRGVQFLGRGSTRRVAGVLLTVFAIGAAIAPPFSGLDTLPAMGAVVVCLALILDDVVFLAVGAAIGCGGVALIIAVGAAIGRAARSFL